MKTQKHIFNLLSLVALLFAISSLAFITDKGKKKKPKAKTTYVRKVKKAGTVDSSAFANGRVVKNVTINNPYKIIIDKSDYELQVYDEQGWLATYPIVFGSKDLGDKMKEGDRRTPTGEFKVLLKKTNKKWGVELLLDYPTQESIAKFNLRKAQGLIPKNAKIGNGIAIHGTRKDEEWTVDNFYNWTDGCVSVKYSDMQELYDMIPEGTPVSIVP
jgi:murein L,D-transpeptidase YafK